MLFVGQRREQRLRCQCVASGFARVRIIGGDDIVKRQSAACKLRVKAQRLIERFIGLAPVAFHLPVHRLEGDSLEFAPAQLGIDAVELHRPQIPKDHHIVKLTFREPFAPQEVHNHMMMLFRKCALFFREPLFLCVHGSISFLLC